MGLGEEGTDLVHDGGRSGAAVAACPQTLLGDGLQLRGAGGRGRAARKGFPKCGEPSFVQNVG